ncbi:PREDICTED: uncharacterized protein LOC105113635 [Populus euphratica]|uniref:Uncharacterized protein LOC105113635 n=1 Tax=Populus euphratica TaxID=75702 RepID=A0AAJ6X751_POPEU|nr:PREDICTED: uncharacterized protein LOC105113635 [Populus euphratica]
MFTEGLDESAINWIKRGSDAEESQPKVRSPLSPLSAEKLSPPPAAENPFPKSPLFYTSSSHLLPPLKFHSGLLTPHSIVSPCLQNKEEDDDIVSVASVSDYEIGRRNYTDEDGFEDIGPSDFDYLEKPVMQSYQDGDEEEIFGVTRNWPSAKTKLNRGVLKEDLKIELPGHFRRLKSTTQVDGDLGFRKSGTPKKNSVGPGGSFSLRERVQLRNAQVDNFSNEANVFRPVEEMGTPSAPPIIEIGGEEGNVTFDTEIEQNAYGVGKPRESGEGLFDQTSQSMQSTECDERINSFMTGEMEGKMPYWQTSSSDRSPCYNTGGQYAWQTMIAYDACIRLCLYAWARGRTEAPEFLRDECLILRSAFGLHKFLLQPRRIQPVAVNSTKIVEQTCPLKAKKVVGKIRVEVKKLRIIPRRKLLSTYSQRSAIYMQMGKEYVQHVSSLVKTGMNSLKIASFPVPTEEKLTCLFQLKSTTENSQVEPGSAICLHPGSGDYHIFFPESEGEALLVEVQDTKKSLQGRATIAISSFNDNPSDRVRWWPLYHEDQECVGKIQLFIGSTITQDETNNIKSGPVVETIAYDLLLEAAMHAQLFHSRNLRLHGSWKWLLIEFADYYGVSDSYTKLRYLSRVMDVALPKKDCLELVNELLVPIMKARSEKSLTVQEKSIFLDCETRIESLLAQVFENYKSLDENSPTGLADLFNPMQESAAPALGEAVKVYTLLHDILSQDAQTMLRNYLQTAAKKRCRKHMVETDEFVSSNSEGFLIDSITISTAYLKMKNLCLNIGKEIQADIRIHNQHLLPSSIDLSNIAAAVYSTELCNRLRIFLSACPPSSPQPHVNELLIAIADFERDLELWNISPVQGGVDSRGLFHSYIMVWVQDMQINLLELCKAEKVPWAGVMTNHSTSPFAEEMYERIKDALIEYEVVINRWPRYSLILENAVADVERAIVKALEKQYNDILTPLKDSIPKRLNMHVQKLTRRQSTTLYSVPNQLGIFLNTIKRILDVLHCRVEDIFKSWASYLPLMGDKKSICGEQMNGITVLLRTKHKNYMQATVEKLVNNVQASRSTRLKRILEDIREEDGEAEVRERMQILSSQLIDCISNLHDVFASRIFVATCRGFWDRMGEIVLKFLESRKENKVWYNGSCYALGILDDTFASQMQRLLGNSLQEKDLEPPRSVIEARSILCRDTANATETSTYFYV